MSIVQNGIALGHSTPRSCSHRGFFRDFRKFSACKHSFVFSRGGSYLVLGDEIRFWEVTMHPEGKIELKIYSQQIWKQTF